MQQRSSAMINETDPNKSPLTGPIRAAKVDEALAAVTSRPDDEGRDALAMDELSALKSEVARLRESATEVTAASGRLARTGAIALREDLEDRIRVRPLAAVAIAAVVGYVWGATR
jgi:ElaB/YqjD/DUF883 family membrane-anchored ribosome-binding protein